QIKGAQLQDLLDLWTAKKGTRRFPAREDITPRDVKSFLRNVTLFRVKDDGLDFEYRVMGDAVVQAWGQSFVGMDAAKMNAIRKGMGEVIRRICASVAARGEPLVVRGELSRSELEHVGQESLFLPLGPDDATVDYILGASDFTAARPFPVKTRN
ncbi:MAG: PAS domain-containing protein, partial [Alphaproteobacteria bacterium]|nr:PAS domain-containing protein [Alphaproteobacteria bacterium]